MTLAMRLKKARLQQNKTQHQLAEEVGIKQQAIQRIEAGKVNSTSYIVHIAKALKTSSNWLAFGPDNEPVPVGINEHGARYSNEFPCVPLFSWNEINQIQTLVASEAERRRVPSYLAVSETAFAIQLQGLDDSMVAPDGKVSFQRHDLVIVDPAKAPKDGSFVLATAKQTVLRKYVAEARISHSNYLAALNPKYESIMCNKQVKIYGTVIQVIKLFS